MSILNLIERLAEMFPKQNYQSRLDRYISEKNPKSTSDVEKFAEDFERSETRGFFL